MIKLINDNYGVVIYARQEGSISIEQMLDGLRFMAENTSLPRQLRIIEDSRKAKITFTHNDIELIVNAINEMMVKYESVRHAVLLDSPINTVFAMLFNTKRLSVAYRLEVFASVERALSWLNTDLKSLPED